MQVSLLSSWQERCGIAEYSRLLVEELRRRAEVEIVPASFRRGPPATYRALGTALNAGEVAHVQHSYAFFGGMHPLRAGWATVAGAVRRPLMVTVHELDQSAMGSYHLPPTLELAYKRRFNRSAFHHPAIRWWMTHSAELKASLVQLGVPDERITYRPMPLEHSGRPLPSPEPLRHSLRLEGKRPLVILGFLARRKGYDLALEALASLPPEFVLVAAGGTHAADHTEGEAWLRRLAAQAGLEDRLRVTGFLSEADLERATALAEVILAPFREMSASASLAYALSREKPIIASDLTENRGLPVERFPNGDAAALANAILQVTGSAARKRELAENAADYARLHSYASLAEETVRAYNQILEERTWLPG